MIISLGVTSLGGMKQKVWMTQWHGDVYSGLFNF